MSTSKKDIPANRYLNLAGAPWSPQKHDRVVTPKMLHTGLGAAVIISLAAYFTPASNPWFKLGNYGGGVAGGAAIVGLIASIRRREARVLSQHHEHLVIDMHPEQGTATSPDIMNRVAKNVVYYNELTMEHNIVHGMGYTLLSTHPLNNDMAAPLSCLMGTAAIMLGVTNSERRRQFERIASGEWVITDSGNAVANFQSEDRKKLLTSQSYAMVPVPIRPSPDK